MKFAINHHLTRKFLGKHTDSFWVVAGFFFHDRGTTVQKSGEGFLREVLYQLIHHQKQLFVIVYSIFAKILQQKGHSTNSSQSLADGWTLKVLRDALELIGRKSTSEVNICLFVDALDEHDGNHREMILILRKIAQLTANPAFRVRLALAGRPKNVFKTAFQGCPGFSIHEYTTDDIRRYVEDKIQAEMPGELSIEYEVGLKNLIEKIVLKAQGVFLWFRLVANEIVEGICEGDTMEELVTLLSTIPTELGELYKRALRRMPRGLLEALIRNRSEAYVMFQIAICAGKPFEIHHFLAATHLTAGRGTYSDLQRLSEQQSERRLNSRAAGLLEVPKGRVRPVQFIHQTVKEFLTTGDGKAVIREGLLERRLESGFSLIYRYTLELFENFIAEHFCLDGTTLVTENFIYYANILEWSEEECVADSFEPKILRLPESDQADILEGIIDKSYVSKRRFLRQADTSPNIFQNTHLGFCYFYVFCNLPLSLKKSLAKAKARMIPIECKALLEAAILLKYHPRGSAQVLQVLTEEGVVRRIFDDLPYLKNEVTELVSQIRELPERKRSSSFSTPNQELLEGG